VHEAYLRLVGGDRDRTWNGRAHFLAAAAQAMRRILVEAARRKARKKRGGEHHRVDLADPPAPDPDDELLALDDALNRLAEEDSIAAKVVELHQFADPGHEETGTAIGITVYVARQKWTYARAWLRDAALELHPTSAVQGFRGWTHLVVDAPKLAQRDFELAIELDPRNGDAYNGRGLARVRLGRRREAALDAAEALRQGPSSPRLYYNAARIYARCSSRYSRRS
jgi:tetratricopeptide (TPR) repeat protein